MNTATLQVHVSRPTPTSAIARPTAESLARARSQNPTTPKALLDVLVQALWLFLARVDASFAGWTEQAGISRATDLTRILDLLTSASGDSEFPYPGSPRYDAVGGGARIAPDGSPGVPSAWVRYFMRGAVSREEAARAHGPLLLALGSLVRSHPQLWRVYSAHTLRGVSLAELSMAYSTQKHPVSVATIRRQVTQARTLLLGYIALYSGAIDDKDLDYLMRLALPVERQTERNTASVGMTPRRQCASA